MTAERYGVIGHPVAHSLSPVIHAAFAEQAGASIDYRRVLAPRDGFMDTMRAFFDAGGRGLNVTLPFKLEAHAACDSRLATRAASAGAVNWLAVDEHGLHGDNTDGAGLVADLERLLGADDRTLNGARVLVLGAGGAARGVIGPLLGCSPASLTLANRDLAKADALAQRFEDVGTVAARPFGVLDDGFDVVINATSASLADDALPIAPAVLGGAHLVYDMMYGPAATGFLQGAARAGASVVADGLGMLIEQAAESYFLWRGFRPLTAPVRDALRARIA